MLALFAEIFVEFESNRLLHTSRDLTLRPGTTIRRYLRGTCQGYYNPVDYALLMGGLSILLSLFLNESLFDSRKAESLRMAEEKAFMAFVIDDIGAFFNMMMILQFPIAGFLTWLRLPNGHYTLGAYLCQRLSVGPCARLQPLIPRLAESPSREWIPAAPFRCLCLVHHRLCLFSYFRLRHGNLKFPRVIWSISFIIGVYGLSLFVGMLMDIGYFYLL
ncbi:MAG: DUF3667 domain-containing protein [Bacteroidetes bacterium]|nr:DUF3667 domain-containing protein [Bacteroidota bacterium]